jgi:hypothetical protein
VSDTQQIARRYHDASSEFVGGGAGVGENELA